MAGNVHVYMLSHSVVFDSFVTPWTVAHQAPLSMGFSKQEYWSGLPCSLPGDLPEPGIDTPSPVSPALAGGLLTAEPPGKPISSATPAIDCPALGARRALPSWELPLLGDSFSSAVESRWADTS